MSTSHRRRICIVSSGWLSSGPRVVKEADALAEAGHEVHVIGCDTVPGAARWDAELAAGRAWRYTAVPWGAGQRRRTAAGIAASLASRASQRVSAIAGPLPVVAELAASAVTPRLLRAALAVPADLYIGHNLPALAVAHAAAKVRLVGFAFDAEDDHFGELDLAAQGSTEGHVVQALMTRHLRHAAYVSAASPAMADAIATRHGISRPTVVRNVFPFAARDSLDGRLLDRRGDALSLHWYSQTIGLDRGIQDAIRAAGELTGPVQIHLRGNLEPAVQRELTGLAAQVGVADRLFFHPQVAPTALLSRCAEHDVGLALEAQVRDNRRLAMTNKLFFYMVAGLAVAASGTPGQRAVMDEAPDVGLVYAPGNHRALARGLQHYQDDPAALQRAREASLAAARERFNWESESRVLVSVVERALLR